MPLDTGLKPSDKANLGSASVGKTVQSTRNSQGSRVKFTKNIQNQGKLSKKYFLDVLLAASDRIEWHLKKQAKQ